MSTLKKSSRKSHESDELQSGVCWQQIQLLFWDIDNLEALYKLGTAKYNLGEEKARRLLARVDQCLERMDEWVTRVLLDDAELDRFAHYRKVLDQLAYDLCDYVR